MSRIRRPEFLDTMRVSFIDTSQAPAYLVWIATITEPYLQTFEGILARPNLNRERAYSWMFIGTIGFSIAYHQWFGYPFSYAPNPEHPGNSFTGVACGLGLLMFFASIILVRLTHALATVIGGKGSFTGLTYTMAAVIAPIGILVAVFSFIPFLKYATVLLLGYALYLLVASVKATYKFSWIEAVITTAIIFGAISLCSYANYITSASWR